MVVTWLCFYDFKTIIHDDEVKSIQKL